MHSAKSIIPAALGIIGVAATARDAVAQTPTDAILIRNVRVFDGERVIPNTSVLVANGKISRVAPTITAPIGATVVDGAGKTLLPGLIDSHTHTWGTALRDAAVFGVTTVLDMFTEAKAAADRRALDATPAGSQVADFRSAGVLATAPKGHGTEYGLVIPTLSTPGEAQAFVDARLAEGSDYIKIVYDDGHSYGFTIPTLDKATLKALVDATHARRRMAVVHIGDQAAARDAIEARRLAPGLCHSHPQRTRVNRVRTRRRFVDERPAGCAVYSSGERRRPPPHVPAQA
jgi:dihydroorotase-like cyclic amidohydrolase